MMTISFVVLCILFLLIILPFNQSTKIVNISAYNNIVRSKNAVADYEKIKTAEVILPVVFANVLHYEPGELGTSEISQKGPDVYYSEEALQDPEFLESVMRSPFTVGTHDKNTNEYNREVDGWPSNTWYDEKEKGVFVKGYVTGADNVEYVRINKDEAKFGTSAYIDFIELVEKEGVAPNGQKYTAIATKLHCNHLAILPNIRDEHNLIVAMNSVKVEPAAKPKLRILEKFKNTIQGKNNMPEEKDNKDKMKEVYNEMEDDKKKAYAMDAINMRLDKMDETMNMYAKNMEKYDPKKNDKPDVDNKGKNKGDEDDGDPGDKLVASNAIPSQDIISTVSNSLGVTFKETPTVEELSKLLGIKEKTFAETLTALNAKCKEIITESAKNAVSEESESFESMLAKF